MHCELALCLGLCIVSSVCFDLNSADTFQWAFAENLDHGCGLKSSAFSLYTILSYRSQGDKRNFYPPKAHNHEDVETMALAMIYQHM